MMNIYAKLMAARIAVQAVKMKKSGKNKFAGYEYFELGDFIPDALKAFADAGLCGVVSFANDTATLTITNTDKPDEQIIISSPMAKAELKGAHEIQNLGAVQTYQRRYLWMTALELVEHDAIASSDGGQTKPETREYERISSDQEVDLLDKIKDAGLKLESFYGRFNIKKLSSLPAEDYQDALAKIAEFKKSREAKSAAAV